MTSSATAILTPPILRYDISLLQAGLSCRSSGVELRDVHLRTFTRFILILDVCADPSVPRPAEPDIVQANFFRGFYRQSVARSAPIDAGNDNSDHLTLEIHQRRPTKTWLDRNDRANVRRHEVSAQELTVETANDSEAGRCREVHRKADGYDRGGKGKLFRVSDRNEGRIVVDLEQCDAASRVGHVRSLAGIFRLP